jgi:hypothetical protein
VFFCANSDTVIRGRMSIFVSPSAYYPGMKEAHKSTAEAYWTEGARK